MAVPIGVRGQGQTFQRSNHDREVSCNLVVVMAAAIWWPSLYFFFGISEDVAMHEQWEYGVMSRFGMFWLEIKK